ncbi:hypothetical protein [Frigidibacter sp. MR17.24]|uniref:hypothetical protein n=1 Tax=Frigidibacter sp. MR17.24 TaxID=3127345 RepID=UPI003012F025
MAQAENPDDPKGLIRESYRIEGIGAAECRSIFLDWALSLPAGVAPEAAMGRLAARHGVLAPTHPMTALLAEGRLPAPTAAAGRRGGAMGRRRPQ